MFDTTSILNYLIVNKSRLLHEYHLTKIGLFGSLARGDHHANSDIDLIIEFEPNTTDLYDLKSKLKSELKSKFNCHVDICRLKYIKPIFKNQIQSEIKYV